MTHYVDLALLILGIAFLAKIWKMTGDIRELKNHWLQKGGVDDRSRDAKIAFLMGNRIKAKDLLDMSYFEELLVAKSAQNPNYTYQKRHFDISKKYERLYHAMSLEAIDFQVYADVNNLP